MIAQLHRVLAAAAVQTGIIARRTGESKPKNAKPVGRHPLMPPRISAGNGRSYETGFTRKSRKFGGKQITSEKTCKNLLYVYNNKHKGVENVSKRNITVMPGTQEILSQMGEQIKLARLRRELPAELVAERAGISRATLWNVEKGSPSVAIGAYAAVLHALNNMDRDLLLVAKDDEFGKKAWSI